MKLAEGDEAFEVVTKGKSRCCTFETDFVAVRVGRFIALIAFGQVGAADEAAGARS